MPFWRAVRYPQAKTSSPTARCAAECENRPVNSSLFQSEGRVTLLANVARIRGIFVTLHSALGLVTGQAQVVLGLALASTDVAVGWELYWGTALGGALDAGGADALGCVRGEGTPALYLQGRARRAD